MSEKTKTKRLLIAVEVPEDYDETNFAFNDSALAAEDDFRDKVQGYFLMTAEDIELYTAEVVKEKEEERCEWNELVTVEQWTSCGINKNRLFLFEHRRDFTYCPYCGKKIERVKE
jgi:hypothetical protein